MRIESSYPTPIMGVSTLAPRNRLRGHAEEQINFRSDPVNKLTRRPPCQWKRTLIPYFLSQGSIAYHSYTLDGTKISYLAEKSQDKVHCFVNDIPTQILDLPVGFYDDFQDRMVMQTVDNDTYLLNKDKVVRMLPDVETDTIQKYSHINVLSSLNYGETVTVNITIPSLIAPVRKTVTYTVPELGVTEPDYDSADQARATKQVASSLASSITSAYADLSALALGSSVAIWNNASNEWLSVEIETGQGDRSCVAINQEVSTTEGLPLFAKVGTRIRVQPDPTSDNGVYYLQAERVGDIPSGLVLEEVVWAESRSPDEPYKLDLDTLPLILTYEDGVFSIGNIAFRDRLKGDNNSVKVPKFVDSTIENIGYFQKRLVFLSDNNVSMSEADDVLNFWKQSAVQLLVSDTVSVASSAVGVDRLKHIVPHNRDLLITSSNGQFKISGSEGITPQSISMSLTARYECQVDVAPVTMGNAVFYPIDYGTSTGIHEYRAEQNTTQDVATPLTNHVIGLMKGGAQFLASNSNLEMLALVTNGNNGSTDIFVYEQYTTSSGKRQQSAWSGWSINGVDEILAIEFKDDRLSIVVSEGDYVVLKEIDMYSKVTSGNNNVYLDDLLKLTVDENNQLTLPDGYDERNIVVVLGENTQYPFDLTTFSLNDRTITLEDEDLDLANKTVYIGKNYVSSYTPTRPFKYDEDGTTITTDRIRVSRYILDLVETNEVKMEIISDYYQTDDQVFNSRYVGELNNLVGKLAFHTGDVKLSFAQDARYAKARFYCDNHLGCSIIGLSWEGQYFQSKGRM